MRGTLLLVAALAVVAAFAQLTTSMGPLGPAYPLFATSQAGFPEDQLDAAGDCGSLEAGVAKRDIVPGDGDPAAGWTLWMEPYEDANGNGVYDAPDPLSPTDPFDPFTDENGNGKWDGPFMAGYGHEKANNEYYLAASVHDPVWARALALRCGSLLLGMVSLDVVGLFQNEVWDIRSRVASAGFDHVIVASTHTHDSVDTMGLWGPNDVTDGKNPRMQEHVKARAAGALLEAAANLEPVTVRAGAGHTQHEGVVQWAGYVQTDLRDPFVLDDVVLAAAFLDQDLTVKSTLVNWSPHPETLAGTRSEISSDFADKLRRAIETEGATVGADTRGPFGGTAVYFSGAVGGMMTTLGARVFDNGGNPVPDHSYAKAERIGEVAAWVAMSSLDPAPVTVDGLRVQVREVTFPIDNVFLAALNTIGVFDHPVAVGPAEVPAVTAVGSGVAAPIPFIRTELNVVTLTAQGAPFLQIVTVPGELLPEIAVGGHLAQGPEASWETCYEFDALKLAVNGDRNGNYNPATHAREPGFKRILAAHDAVPPEPVIRDRMQAQYKFLFGLANDELGYIVPANDFIAAVPYWYDGEYDEGRDRCGDDDHYEETVSASSVMAPVVANNLAHMLDPGFVPAEYPVEVGGVLGDPGNVEGVLYGEAVGVWLDTSGSNGHEAQEDARVQVALPSYLSGAWGFLDREARDMGQEPGEETHGLWIDLNGNEGFDEGDGVVFADHWATGG